MAGAPRSRLIDRDRQNIPLPLGGMAPVRMHSAGRGRGIRTFAEAVVLVIAVCAALAAMVLLLLPTTVGASLDGGRLDVGSMVLTQVGTVPQTSTILYGGDASYALIERGDGSARGAAAWTSSGIVSSGLCDLRRVGLRLVEYCTFTGAPVGITSVDVLDPASGPDWQRTYADGVRVTIAVPPDGAVIPVPFPIGR